MFAVSETEITGGANSTSPPTLVRATTMDDLDDSFFASFDMDAAMAQASAAAAAPAKPAASFGGGGAAGSSGSSGSSSSSFSSFSSSSSSSSAACSAGSAAATPMASPLPSLDDLRKTLRRYYGHPDFRDGQAAVLSAVLSGQDTAVFWATGSGKSLMYQLPALHTQKVVLVVSPLISLMQDQVSSSTTRRARRQARTSRWPASWAAPSVTRPSRAAP